MRTTMYLSSDKQNNYEIGKGLGLKDTALNYFSHALQSIELQCEVDIVTGDCMILKVNGREVADE